MRFLILILCLTPFASMAEIVVPIRTIRAKEVIVASDLEIKAIEVKGAVRNTDMLVGQEARVALYPGRPIRPGDIGPPAVVDRNDLVTLVFDHVALSITAEGRALGRGAVGERIRVMNLASRTTVEGVIRPDGQIEVN